MPTTILEIGPGDSPALEKPGTLFANGIDYSAVDVSDSNSRQMKRGLELVNGSRSKPWVAEYAASLVFSDGVHLPFPDNSFSHVIMRSVFGEYTMNPDWTGSFHENVDLNIFEAFRVLQTGGTIAIAEENEPRAPASVGQIGEILIVAGFENVTVFPCQGMQNQAWIDQRTRYWGLDTLDPSRWASSGQPSPHNAKWAFLLTAQKSGAVLSPHTMYYVDDATAKANLRRGNDHPDYQDPLRHETFMRVSDDQLSTVEPNELITVQRAHGMRHTLAHDLSATMRGDLKSVFL